MWPFQKQNKNLDPEQPATQSTAPDTTLTRVQLARLRKLERIIQRIRVQDERCGLSLEMSARQGFRPEVDRVEELRLRQLVDQYIKLVARARDEVGLDVEKNLSPEDRLFMQRIVDDHQRPTTEGPPPIEIQVFLETGTNITTIRSKPRKQLPSSGDGLDWMLS